MKTKKALILILIIFLQFIFINKYSYGQDIDLCSERKIYNVLLIGIDGFGEKQSRADSMIILTVDNKNKYLKLTSLARDTLVDIEGIGKDKLNHAYAYGGVDLLLNTINKNLELDIEDYAIIDFKGFIDLINILDGVEIEIEEREINGLNKVINSCYSLNISDSGNNTIEYITSSGKTSLNGYQALAYCRLRKIDNCFFRDARQRKVLNSLAEKLSKISIYKYPQLIQILLKYVDVNISTDKILDLAIKSRLLSSYEIKQLQFPNYKYRYDGILERSSAYVIRWDREENIEILHDFIYY